MCSIAPFALRETELPPGSHRGAVRRAPRSDRDLAPFSRAGTHFCEHAAPYRDGFVRQPRSTVEARRLLPQAGGCEGLGGIVVVVDSCDLAVANGGDLSRLHLQIQTAQAAPTSLP